MNNFFSYFRPQSDKNNFLAANLWLSKLSAKEVRLLTFLPYWDKELTKEKSDDHSGVITLGGRSQLIKEYSQRDAAHYRHAENLAKDKLFTYEKAFLERGLKTTSSLRAGLPHEQLEIFTNQGLAAEKEALTLEELKEVLAVKSEMVFIYPSNFKAPEKVLIAFNGKKNGKAMLKKLLAMNLDPQVEYHLVGVNLEEVQLDLQAKDFTSKGLKIITKKLSGDKASAALLAYQEEIQAELLVMGAYSQNFFMRLLKGSDTDKLLEAYPQAFLIIS